MPHLVERESELGKLEAAVADAKRGHGRLILVEGPAGSGKTTLLKAVHECAHASDALTGFATANPLEQLLEFEVLIQLMVRVLDDLPEDVASRVLHGAAADAGTVLRRNFRGQHHVDQAQFATAFGSLATNLANERPMVLCVDDAHWSDRVSLGTLRAYASSVAEHSVVLVLGLRSGDTGSEDVEALRALPNAIRLPLAPLSEQGIVTLAVDRGAGTPSPATLLALSTATGGNPFFVDEIIKTATPGGIDDIELRPSESIVRTVRGWTEALSETEQSVVAWCSVFGEHVTRRRIQEATGISDAEVQATVAQLIAMDLVASTEDLQVKHPLLREALLLNLPSSDRALRHHTAAHVLADEGASDAAVAAQLLLSEPVGDPSSVTTLIKVAEAALNVGDVEHAHTLLQRARLEPPPADQGVRLLALSSRVDLARTKPDSALAHLTEILQMQICDEERAWCLSTVSLLAPDDGDITTKIGLIEHELHAQPWPEETRLLLETSIAAVAHLIGYTPGWLPRRLPRYATFSGDTPGECRALAILPLYAHLFPLTPEDAGDMLRRALRDDVLLDADGPRSPALLMALSAMPACGQHDAAVAASTRMVAAAQRQDSATSTSTSTSTDALQAIRRFARTIAGDLHEAAEDASEPSTFPEICSFLGLYQGWASTLRSVEQGLSEELAAQLNGAPDPPHRQCSVHLAYCRAVTALARGDNRAALSEAQAVRAAVEEDPGLLNPLRLWQEVAARAEYSLRRMPAAEAHVTSLEAESERWPIARTRGKVLQLRALLRTAESIPLLSEAQAIFEGANLPLDHARVCLDLGARIRVSGQRREAARHIETAFELARACGATVLAQRAGEELNILRSHPTKFRPSGLEALTASELRIARLAAEGPTNRQIAETLFITEKTVENHLMQVYVKLGITSRSELPSAVLTMK